MTTPPTTAGWYPDPDGSGGQRYWDGAAWTDERPAQPAAAAPASGSADEETSAWPTELPPWPEDMAMPSWDEAGKSEPVADEVEPVADQSEPESEPEPEPVLQPEVDEALEPTEPAVADPVEELPAPETAVEVDAPENHTTATIGQFDQPTAVVTLPVQPPLSFAAGPEQPASGSSPLKGYLIGVGGLLVVLVAVLVWALGFAQPGTGTTDATGGATGAAGATGTNEAASPATDSAEPTGAPADQGTGGGQQVADGDVTLTNKGVEITSTVSAVDNEMLTKSASGEFVVVRLTLLNNGQLPATFLADQQVLNAGGQTFNAETESTFYLGGISAVLYPGQPVDVAFAYDVPPGTTPESLQVHGDLASAGATLPLS